MDARFDSRIMHNIIDQGPHTMKLRILPHKGDWRCANVPRIALQFNVPPITHIEPNHPGKRNLVDSFLEVSQDNVIVCAIKKAERDDCLVIRAYESFGMETKCDFDLKFLKVKFSANFSPFEIKTFKILSSGEARETNLLED